MNELQKALHDTHCKNCGMYWLGSFWGKPFCNECAPNMELEQVFDEPDGEDPTDEDESKVDIDDENLNDE